MFAGRVRSRMLGPSGFFGERVRVTFEDVEGKVGKTEIWRVRALFVNW